MWSVAIDYGLSSEMFWELSLAEFEAIAERKKDRERGEYFRSAQVCAILVNIHNANSGNRGETVQPSEFMPEGFLPEVKQQTPEEQFTMLNFLRMLTGGDVAETATSVPEVPEGPVNEGVNFV